MDVFIVVITGRIGRLLTQELLSRGDTVRGLVRRDQQRVNLAARGVEAVVGDRAFHLSDKAYQRGYATPALTATRMSGYQMQSRRRCTLSFS